jgi:hypothetical protein
VECLGGLRTGGAGRLEAWVSLGATRLIAGGKQGETQASHLLEPLGGFPTGQSQGRPAGEREQRAGVANELGEDRLGDRLRH